MNPLKDIVDSYMQKVPGLAFTSIGLNYFTAVILKVEEFNKKFIENGKIKDLGLLLKKLLLIFQN